jgi:hypothetical protein
LLPQKKKGKKKKKTYPIAEHKTTWWNYENKKMS